MMTKTSCTRPVQSELFKVLVIYCVFLSKRNKIRGWKDCHDWSMIRNSRCLVTTCCVHGRHSRRRVSQAVKPILDSLFECRRKPPAWGARSRISVCNLAAAAYSSTWQHQKDNTMNDETQTHPTFVVGVDAHSRKLAISIWEGTYPWNPVLPSEIGSCEINAMEKNF